MRLSFRVHSGVEDAHKQGHVLKQQQDKEPFQLHEILTSSKYKHNILFGMIEVTCGVLRGGEVKRRAASSAG